MKRKTIILSVLFLAFVFAAVATNAAEWVNFEDKTPEGEILQLAGILSKPKGNGPFPAVVMLHGCFGLGNEKYTKSEDAWVERLVSWDYVTFQADSFRPRNYDNICEKGSVVNDTMRSNDAYSAKSYLAKQKFVDSKNIAVIGWSHGGWAVMRIIDGRYRDKDSTPFKAAIAFYPWCSGLSVLDTPVLILIGQKDDWHLAILCESLQQFGVVKNISQRSSCF